MKRIIAAVLAVLLLFTGCGSKKTLGFDIASGVESFDPQLASSDSELIIVRNCFQGLMDKDESGALICGAAESYTLSEDGMTYTFYLRENLFWSDGETPITSDDFLFAFVRLFSAETNAPSRSDFFGIKNSEAALAGKISSELLGVKAPDSRTLVISLSSPDPFFLDLLVTAAAMPCNRAFFENTKGRYGLGLSYTLFNGAYYVRRINNASYVLSPNENSPIKNSEYQNIYLFVKDDPRVGAVSRLNDETVDAAVISPADRVSLRQSGYTIRESENTLWAIAFNVKDESLSNAKLRRAISYAIDKSLLSDKIDKRFRIAEAYVPKAITLDGKSYRTIVGESFSGFDFDPDIALSLYKEGLEELGATKIPTLTLICTEEFVPAMGYVQKSVQDNLAVFINLIPVTEAELSAALASGDYDMALCSITPQYNNPGAILSVFTDQKNFTGFYDADFNKTVNSASQAATFEEMAENYSVAEQQLMQYMPALPVFYETSYFAVSPKVSGLNYSAFGGHIIFRFCK